MWSALREWMTDLTRSDDGTAFADNDYRLAAAALLVHAADIDGSISPVERTALHNKLKAQFGLDDPSADTLIAQATEADNEAVDLYRFTSVLMRRVDEAGRKQIVALMWQIAYADGTVTEFEDNLLWRVSDLLGIDARDRMLMKQEAAGQA